MKMKSVTKSLNGFLSVPAALILLAGAATPIAAQDEVFSTEELCRKNYQTGMEYKKNLKYQDAEEFLTLVVETCPDKLEAYLNLGEVQRFLEKYMDAIDTYDRALEIEPRNLDVQEALAYTYGASGDLDESIRLYQKILDVDPEREGVYQNLAFLYEKQGKWPEALMMYKKVLARNPDKTDVLQKIARTALDHKLYLEAMNLYEKLYAAMPEDIGVLRILGYFYYQVKLYESAVPIYQTILEREPDSPSSLFEMKILAICLKEAGRPGEAAEVYERIIEREPENLQNYYNLAFMYIDLRDFGKAQDAIQRGLSQDPNYVCLYYAWGKIHENQAKVSDDAERFDEAVGLFGKAKEKYQKCAGSGAFCSSTCQREIERQDALIDRTAKRKQKKALEGGGDATPASGN